MFFNLIVVLPTIGLLLHRLPETEIFLLILLSSRWCTKSHHNTTPRTYLLLSLTCYVVTMSVYSYFNTDTDLLFALLMQAIYLLFIIHFSRKDTTWTLMWNLIAVQFYLYKPEYGYLIAITLASSMMLMLFVIIIHPKNLQNHKKKDEPVH